MNHTGNKNSDKVARNAVVDGARNSEAYLVVAVMFTYAILLGLLSNPVNIAAGLVVSTLLYFLGIYLYYGVARLAFSGRNLLLWSGGVLAFVISYAVTGMSGLWSLLTGWSMILFAGTVVGRLSRSGQRQLNVYMIAMLCVATFALLQFWPVAKETMSGFSTIVDQLIQDARDNMATRDWGTDAAAKSLDSVEKLLGVGVRLIPAFTVLGAVLPFSVAYLIFSHRLGKGGDKTNTVSPFILWKMPFAVMPILIVAMVLRLLGTDTLKLTADNVLAFLLLFYSITGLALMEFYLRKFNFSTVLKIMFYIVFFLSQFIGLFVAAFLGFVDSFVDWRKVQQLSLEKK